MKLTGQCKIDFEKWYDNKFFPSKMMGQSVSIIDKGKLSIQRFYSLDSSMQYGVIVDFFDANDIIIEITLEAYYQVHINQSWQKNNSDTLHEAREKAVEAANNIYNQQSEEIKKGWNELENSGLDEKFTTND